MPAGKPFDAACASNIQEKSHALRNLTHAFNRTPLIDRKKQRLEVVLISLLVYFSLLIPNMKSVFAV